jgi:cell division protein FtsB
MGALALIPSTGLPPARARLVNLTRRISDAEAQLDRLTRGRDQLRAELSRADIAKVELDSLISEDASSLVGKLRSGASWALAHFGSARAQNLVASLSESQVQLGVGTKALTAIEAEIAVSEREVADLKSGKADLVRAVLLESAGGFRSDLATSIENLRESMAILAALGRITARSDGSFTSNDRVVVEIPALGGLPAQAVSVPESSIATALRVWGKYSQTLGDNPLSSADEMKFPPVNPHADEGLVLYDRLTATERNRVDQDRAQGVK